MIGQINRGTRTGDFIYNTCLRSDINTVVEIGTWNGMGSTKCIADALLSRFDESNLVSIESNRKMHEVAKRAWDDLTLNYKDFMKSKIKLLHGRIIEKEEMIGLDEIRNYKNYILD